MSMDAFRVMRPPLEPERVCRNCRFWEEDVWYSKDGRNLCTRISEWNSDKARIDNGSILITSPDFGCNQWEEGSA